MAESDTIFLCLPTSKDVRQAIFGEKGIVEGVQPGTLVIDQTSGDPIATRATAKDLRSRGVTLVDAPVSGGVKGVEAGTIAIKVETSPEDFARVYRLSQPDRAEPR